MVPDAISEWKPEIAPQATVMKAKGKTLPPKTGPAAVDELRQRRHQGGGCIATIPIASATMVPILMNAER